MSVSNRIKALKDKHAALDAEVRLLQLLPSNNQEQIRLLKKQKLKIKDEITRLENPNRLTAPKKSKRKKPETPVAGDHPVQVVEVDTGSEESVSDIDLAA